MPECLRLPDFLTSQQVADRFGRSPSWVRRQPLLRVGLGRAPLYHRRACDAFAVARHDHRGPVLRQVQVAAVAAYYKLPYEKTGAVVLVLQQMRRIFDQRRRRSRMAWRAFSGMRAAVKYAHDLITLIAQRHWYVQPHRPSSLPTRPPRMPVPSFFSPDLWYGLQETMIGHCQQHYEPERMDILERYANRHEIPYQMHPVVENFGHPGPELSIYS